MTERPRDKMARIFGLGKYGFVLADEILRQHERDIADWLILEGHTLAADELLDKCLRDEEPLL